MIPMPRRYSVYETKAKLSEVLRLVKAGQEVTVTERNQPIAKVVPFTQDCDDLASHLKTLYLEGKIRRGKLPKHSELKRGLSIEPRRTPGSVLARFIKDRNS
jgi:prevent-host-death family protein